MQKLLIKTLGLIAIVAVVYFGNKLVHTQLGKAALAELPFTVHSLEDATKIAEQSGKVVLADYSAIWCPSCRKLDTQVLANSLVADTIQRGFVFARLDHDTSEGQAFAAKHNLSGFPRVLVLNTRGDKITEMPLTFEPSAYNSNLIKVMNSIAPSS